MILKNVEILNDEFFHQKFANRLLTDTKTIRIGNIISFVSPVQLTVDKSHFSDQSINFCLEIPDISSYAGVCVSELFITNCASILGTRYLKEPIEITNSEIIIKKEHTNGGVHQLDGVVSLNKIINLNGTMLIYLGLYNKAGINSRPRSFSLNFDVDTVNRFMDDVNGGFYNLVNGIFLKTAKM
jgi:hypothetical protein